MSDPRSPESSSPAPAADSAVRPAPSDSQVRIVRIDSRLRIAAAGRLIGQGAAGGQRFLETAVRLGIDVSCMWGTVEGDSRRVRHACLAVCGAGHTAMFFISGDASGPARPADVAAALAERTALIREACRFIALPVAQGGRGVRLAQALLEPREAGAAAALRAAGFLQLGNLEYFRLTPIEISDQFPPVSSIEWPPEVRVHRIVDLPPREAERLMLEAMERSYIDTLDCPELCGLRRVDDVLESHRAVGVHDPSLWWVVTSARGDRALGCMFLSPCPEQETIELVYLGLAPEARGRGLASRLLRHGADTLRRRRLTPAGGLTCAVDSRNIPAVRLYGSMGFESFATREPFVLGLSQPC